MSGHGVPWIKAKVDTGARTSSLHAFDLEEVVVEGRDHVSFHPWQATDEDAVGLTLPVHDRRSVRSSSGHAEDRIVVLMRLTLARRRITAEVTLTDRDEMGFRMLVGRQALEQARCGQAVVGDQRTAKGRERVGVVEVHDRGAVVHAGRQVDAHLLDDVAPNL